MEGDNVTGPHDADALWSRMELLPLSGERWMERHWWLLFAVPLALFGCALFTDGSRFLTDPYLDSLMVALALSAVAFQWWRRTFQTTFGNALKDGWIVKSPSSLEKFRTYSELLCARLRSRRRYLLIAVCVLVPLVVNLGTAAKAIRFLSQEQVGMQVEGLLLLVAQMAFIVWAYAIGAVLWCLLATAAWISSAAGKLEIQLLPGHPDGCGGMEGIGRCCFRAVVPILIGVVLLALWSFSGELSLFKRYGVSYFNHIQPISSALAVTLTVIGGVFAVMPLRGFHALMENFNAERERAYIRQLARAVRELESAVHNERGVRAGVRAVKSSQDLAPAKLKMSNWPFDHRLVVRYAFTPGLSVLLSVMGDMIKSWFVPS